jgi:type I restriction enzyme M protein
MTQNEIVQKLWNLCDVLRDDGINYSDYVTELVLLLFIKMEHENAQRRHGRAQAARRRPLARLASARRPQPAHHYKATLLKLRSDDPLISAIYADAQTSMKEPRHLEQLIKRLDSIDWFSASATAWATSTKACWRRTPARPRAAPASTSPRGH